jgi:methyl-accepting chemotaxis protein
MTNWQVFFIAFPLWVFAVGTIVLLLLVFEAVRKYGGEIKASLDDLQNDVKQITNSAANEVPDILKNVNETTEQIKNMTGDLKQLTSVLPLLVRPSWANVLMRTLPSVISLLGSRNKGNNKKVK